MNLISFEAYELLKKTGKIEGIYVTTCEISHLRDIYLRIEFNQEGYSIIRSKIRSGLLIELTGNIEGSVRTVYILNPFLMKKRDTFKNQILELFDKTLIAKK